MGTLQHKGGGEIMLLPEHLVGRATTCDLHLNDPSISSRQASLRWNGSGWEVQDLGSRNGTHVGAKRIEVGAPVPLYVGTTLRFGDADTEWVLVDGSPPGPMKPGSGRSVFGAKMRPGRLPAVSTGGRTGAGIWSRYTARS